MTRNRSVYYIEASIDMRSDEPSFDWEQVNESLPLIFCSLGSQAHLYQESKQVFHTIIEAMRARPGWQMILSVGRHLSAEFSALPPNVLVVNWAPQLEILKRASIMITHGGLGAVKECILLGVPMIVFPMSRNQPMSGARVVYHGLGVRGDMRRVTVESVHALVEKIERNPSYKQRVREMSEKFREVEESGRGVKIIEKILGVLERKTAHRSSAAVT
jgi:MGT family glycosyltransferase